MSNIYQKRVEDLYDDLQSRLISSGLTNTNPDSFVNILSEFISNELVGLSNEMNQRLNDFSISTAKGDALDNIINETYGFQRFPASRSYSGGENVKLINTSNIDITIPSNTRISSGSEFNENGAVYEILEEVIVPAEGETFAEVLAEQPGRRYNVAENTLNNIDIENNSIFVTNTYAIINGRDRELDEEYRSRGLAFLDAKASHNSNFLKLKLLETPGVYDLKLKQGYRGLGTLSVFAISDGNRTNPALKRLVENKLEELKMPGEKIYYEEGTKVLVNVEITLLNDKKYSVEEIERIKFRIRSIVAEEFIVSKRRENINFSNIGSKIRSEIGSQYNFYNENSNTVFSKINCSYVNQNSSENRVIKNINLLDRNISLSLNVEDIPVLNEIEIKVRSVL
jgi:uncharacterized phage protein gp47/JayE